VNGAMTLEEKILRSKVLGAGGRIMAPMRKPDALMTVCEYLIDRVSDLASSPVPRKAAKAWLCMMAAAVAVSGVVIIVRLGAR
jgi:hypothetical protein